MHRESKAGCFNQYQSQYSISRSIYFLYYAVLCCGAAELTCTDCDTGCNKAIFKLEVWRMIWWDTCVMTSVDALEIIACPPSVRPAMKITLMVSSNEVSDCEIPCFGVEIRKKGIPKASIRWNHLAQLRSSVISQFYIKYPTF